MSQLGVSVVTAGEQRVGSGEARAERVKTILCDKNFAVTSAAHHLEAKYK